jgi:hypothetical protein
MIGPDSFSEYHFFASRADLRSIYFFLTVVSLHAVEVQGGHIEKRTQGRLFYFESHFLANALRRPASAG